MFSRRGLNQWNSEEAVTFTMSKAEGRYSPPKRSLMIRFIGFAAEPKSVSLSGRVLDRVTSERLGKLKEGWTHQPDLKLLLVRFPDDPKELRVVVRR
jgi:hypothetical protein